MAAACLLINCERANVGALCLTRDPPAMIYLAQFMSVTGFSFLFFFFLLSSPSLFDFSGSIVSAAAQVLLLRANDPPLFHNKVEPKSLENH